MKTACSIGFVLLLAFGMVPSAEAVDEGQTQPKLNSKELSLSSPNIADLIPLTSGSGNIKGVLCKSTSNGSMLNSGLQFYVDGGPVHTLSFDWYPFFKDNEASYSTGIIPMNLRFESSIRVVMYRNSASAKYVCMASWGLD